MKISAYDWVKNISEDTSLGLNNKVKDKFNKKDWVPEDHILDGVYKACVDKFKEASPESKFSKRYDITDPDTNKKVGFKLTIMKTEDSKIQKSLNRDTIFKGENIETSVIAVVIFLIISGKNLLSSPIFEEVSNGYQSNSRDSNILLPKGLDRIPDELLPEYKKLEKAKVNEWLLPYNGFRYFYENPDIDTTISSIEKIAKAYKIAVASLDARFGFAKYLDDNFAG